MTANEYLQQLIDKRANSNQYTQNELQAYLQMERWINDWRQSLNAYWYSFISIRIEKSGSRAKGTSIKGKSDIDIFVSITDPNNERTTEQYYESLYDFLKPKLGSNMRKQNVSFGISYAGCSIDVTPAKKLNTKYTKDYLDYYDHNLWSNKRKRTIKTNIQRHIDLVHRYGRQKEIMLIKMWRNCHNIELPSIYIEILARDVLGARSYVSDDLWQDTKKLLIALRDTIMTRVIIDPSNSDNIISDSIDSHEKETIAKTARNTLNEEYVNNMIW